MAKNGRSKFFPTILFIFGHSEFFSANFSQKDWYKFGMAKNGHSEFFLPIFPKKTGINLEQPKMVVPNFFWQFFPKRLV